MRFNPFAQAFGKRRAAMTGDEAPGTADPVPARPAGAGIPGPTGDQMTALRDHERFGFAHDADGSALLPAGPDGSPAAGPDPAVDPDPGVGPEPTAGRHRPEAAVDDGIGGRGSDPPADLGSASIHPPKAPEAANRDHEPAPPRLAPQPVAAAPPRRGRERAPLDGPPVHSSHIERLRAEIGGGDPHDGGGRPERRQGTEAALTSASPRAPRSSGDDDGEVMAKPPERDPRREEPGETSDAADDQPPYEPDLDDVAVTIGRVVSIRGTVVWGALFDDVGGQTAKAARMGALVSMRGPDSRVFGIVNRLEREQQAGSAQAERTIFEIQVLGEIADSRKGFQRGVSSYPPLDAPVTTVTLRDIATIYARPKTSNVHIGRLRHNPRVPAFVLTDSLLGKHFAVLGTTGTGKSCAVTVILRSILDDHPQGHVILLDPHNEYGPAFADRAELLNPRNLLLPYWLLNFEEIAHILLGSASKEHLDSKRALLKDAILRAKRVFAGGDAGDSHITVDTPVPYRLSDLVATLKDGMGMLNKADGTARYLGLVNRVESLRADRRYAFMFSSLTVRDNMQQVLAQLLRIPTRGKPITIIDLAGLPSEVVDVVVSVLFRLTFELAVWSERGKAPPVLLVCEEAHRYVPEESGLGFAPTKRVIARIAKEGRKYGVTLCLVSQRPSELAVSSLAQCNTIFALRLSNEHDQAFVARTLSENARWLVDSLPSLNTQEAVVVGDGVTVPVHIRFNDLEPNHRPASRDPSFSASWRREADDTFLGEAIDRWRRQAR